MTDTAWVPDYETVLVETFGDEWPTVLVKKFECNDLGERRFVGTRIYKDHPPPEHSPPIGVYPEPGR